MREKKEETYGGR